MILFYLVGLKSRNCIIIIIIIIIAWMSKIMEAFSVVWFGITITKSKKYAGLRENKVPLCYIFVSQSLPLY